MSLKRRGILGLLSLGWAGPVVAQMSNQTSSQLPGGGLIGGESNFTTESDRKLQPSSVETSAFPQWEYRVVSNHRPMSLSENAAEMQKQLDSMGTKGWEYVSGERSAMIFKRSVPITINLHVYGLDSNSINDNSVCVADAVNKAINNGHPIRNAIAGIAQSR